MERFNTRSNQKVLLQKSGQATKAIILALLSLLILSGCSKRYDDMPVFLPINLGESENQSVGRFKTSFVVDQIDYFYRGTGNGPIGVTTLVNLDDLYNTSSFGRMYAEQMMSELAMRGFDVVELRHADALQFLADSGEFALSRDIGSVRRARDLSGVVVGTYVASPERVYVNVRMIDPSTSMIVSSASAEMSKTKEIARMLRGGSSMPVLERIPVKHLGRAVYPLAYFPNRVVVPLDDEGAFVNQPPSPVLNYQGGNQFSQSNGGAASGGAGDSFASSHSQTGGSGVSVVPPLEPK